MESFCQGEQIWDFSQLWNTSTPIFNHCFQRTLPIYLPAILLWIFAPLQVFCILKKCAIQSPLTTIPYNWYNVSRLFAILAIVTVNSLQFAFDFIFFLRPDPWHRPSTADLIGSLLNVFTFTLFAFLLFLHRLYGHHTSGLAWLFTFISLLLALPSVYMYAFYPDGADDLLLDTFNSGITQSSGSKMVEMCLFAAHFGLLLFVFLLTCYADKTVETLAKKSAKNAKKVDLKNDNETPLLEKPLMNHRKTEETQRLDECPDSVASFLSRLTYWWFNDLSLVGFRKTLNLEDLWAIKGEDSTASIAPQFDRAWSSQQKPGDKKASGTTTALIMTFGPYFASGVFFKFIYDLLMFVNPQLLKIFIDFISTSDEPNWHGYLLAFLFFLTAMLQSVLINIYFDIMYTVGMRIRTALISSLYRKSLHLSTSARSSSTTGEIVNLMQIDVQKIVDLIPYANLIWSAPLQVTLTLYFLWAELGPSVLAGLAVLVALIPLNGWISSIQRRYQIAQMERKDERVKVIGEVLAGIRLIKLYGWEVPWISQIGRIREKEIAQLQRISSINAFTSIIWTCSPFAVSFVSFGVYVLSSSENILDAKKAFVCLSLFELLRFPLTLLPEVITSWVMASVSVKRLDRFLNAEQLEMYVAREVDLLNSVKITNGFFAWSVSEPDDSMATPTDQTNPTPTTSTTKMTLCGIDLTIRKGSLVAVVGQVASGKSSLLSAILGDMQRIEGTVNVSAEEKIAYVAQAAWIQNASLRENILFGSPFEASRYEAVLEMCALTPDIAILPAGDATEIGERGINLSGGQKQRVALARACYSAASLLLLDDPLSAVDSHVAKHIFNRVLSNESGYLAKKTRILVTNSVAFLHQVDQIVVLKSGVISEMGTYTGLMESGGLFAEFIKEHTKEQEESQEEDDEEVEEGVEELRELNANERPKRRTRTISTSSGKTSLKSMLEHRGSSHEQTDGVTEDKKELIATEHTETGNVKLSVYAAYFRSLTGTWIGLILLGYIGMQVASVGSNVWLAVWSSDQTLEDGPGSVNNQTMSAADSNALRNYRLSVYGSLGLAQGIFFFFGAISLVKGTINSSKTLHRSLLDRIMRAPLSFFDTTPLGRIVNRFSKDCDTVDSTLPFTMDGWLICFLQVLATFLLISLQVPAFMLVVLPILLLYFFIQKYYIATSRPLKRLESTTRSPIYSHFGETLSGVSSIRAFALEERFIGTSNERVDTHQRVYYPSFIANRWLSLRLELCANLIVLFTGLFSVWSKASFEEAPGYVGLILTYSFSVTSVLNWCVRMTSEMETNVVSVERIGEYSSLEMERPWKREVNEHPKLPPGWPQRGEVKFEEYSVRYRAGLDLVLERMNLQVAAGEKIGIVGRTGAGKSSLSLALFRILEAASGRILLDGVDISTLGLHELRSRLSIIPQDPVLFSGSLRSNLDPFSVYSAEQLWTALEDCHLKEYVAKQEGGLEFTVAENGSNLSLGQRQLVCLGRALLRRTRVLVLDEATAAIDLTTDAIVQETIRRQFADCTVLTIAHRINTILDADRVLVLEKGRVAEFDKPAVLLADRRSQFYGLAKDAGIV